MSWAARRRFVVFLILGAFALALGAVTLIATFYRPPSCVDGVQNQGERGIDCGGPCPYLCTADEQPPTVLFTHALAGASGDRTDVIASVENKNPDAAAKDVPYRIVLYGPDQALIQETNGVLELPPESAVPVYIPGIASGKQTVKAAFLSIDPASVRWYPLAKDPRVIPQVSNTILSGTREAPRVSAILSNSTVIPLTNVKVVIVVHNGGGNVIGASQTLLPEIPAQGQATATFTWSSAFPDIPVSFEVRPLVPLP